MHVFGFFIILWLRNGEENTSAWFRVKKSVVEGQTHYLAGVWLHSISEEKIFVQWSSVVEQRTCRTKTSNFINQIEEETSRHGKVFLHGLHEKHDG